MEDLKYESLTEATLDIIANTDVKFQVAQLVAPLVYDQGWTYDNGPMPRSIRLIGPDYSNIVIELSSTTKEYFGYQDDEPEQTSGTLLQAFRDAGFGAHEDEE